MRSGKYLEASKASRCSRQVYLGVRRLIECITKLAYNMVYPNDRISSVLGLIKTLVVPSNSGDGGGEELVTPMIWNVDCALGGCGSLPDPTVLQLQYCPRQRYSWMEDVSKGSLGGRVVERYKGLWEIPRFPSDQNWIFITMPSSSHMYNQMTKVRTRRGHQKSRKGCFECKRRKIKVGASMFESSCHRRADTF